MARIDALFDRLLDKKGSDLHLGVGLPPMGRIRGELIELRDKPVTTEEIHALLFEIVNDSGTLNASISTSTFRHTTFAPAATESGLQITADRKSVV